MTATIVGNEQSSETNLESLRVCVAELNQATKGLTESLVSSRLRKDNLVAERGPLVLPARSQKDSRAQKRLNAIDEQLIPLKRDIADDEAALAELSAQLVLARNDVERAEWELRRVAVRRMIESCAQGKRAAMIEKAVNALSDTLQAAKDEDDAIRAAMLSFDPRLHRETRPLAAAESQRSSLAGWKLKDLLPIDITEFRYPYRDVLSRMEFAEIDSRFLGTLLEAINRLELVF